MRRISVSISVSICSASALQRCIPMSSGRSERHQVAARASEFDLVVGRFFAGRRIDYLHARELVERFLDGYRSLWASDGWRFRGRQRQPSAAFIFSDPALDDEVRAWGVVTFGPKQA